MFPRPTTSAAIFSAVNDFAIKLSTAHPERIALSGVTIGSAARLERVRIRVRAHAHEPIRVSDLASISGMSRRSLEKHLKRVLGRTVFDIIRGQQLAHARRLIEHSDRPLEDIVDHTAFSSSSHLTREFIKNTGLAPGAYRKATGAK